MKTAKEGDIVYTSWGYSMTIVQFYKVMKVTAKTLVVEELKAEETETGFLTGTSLPTEEFTSKKMSDTDLRLYKRDNGAEEIYISNKGGFRRIYYIFDGKPVYYNHCD